MSLHKSFHYEFSHRRTTDVPVADEEYAVHAYLEDVSFFPSSRAKNLYWKRMR